MVQSEIYDNTKGYQYSFSDYFSDKDYDMRKQKQTSITRKFYFDYLSEYTSKLIVVLKILEIKLLQI